MCFGFNYDRTLCYYIFQEEGYLWISQMVILFSSNNDNCPEYQDIVQELQFHILTIISNRDWHALVK